MAKLSDYIRMTLFVNYENQGFSETYALQAGSIQSATQDALQIASWRADLLGDKAKIVWAKMERMQDLRKSYAIVPNRSTTAIFTALPIPGKLAEGADVDEEKKKLSGCETGFLFRFESDEGHHTNRLIRAVPDVLIQNRANILGFFTLPANFDALVTWAPGGAYLDCMRNYLNWVRKKTIWTHNIYAPGVNNKPVFVAADTEQLTTIFQRGVANRKVGRPFAMSRGRAKARG